MTIALRRYAIISRLIFLFLSFFLFSYCFLFIAAFVPQSGISQHPAASNGGVDPRGSRQMCMQACPLGSLLAGINGFLAKRFPHHFLLITHKYFLYHR